MTRTTDTDLHDLVSLAIGRILRLGSRPTEPGDIQEYERCRRIVMDAVDPTEVSR